MLTQQSTQWYRSAVDQLTQVAVAIQRQEYFDLNRVSSLASDIVESHGRSDELIVQALTVPGGSPGSQLITNLINVGILAAKVGAGLGYEGIELERLALAGLVHDIGLLAVPQSLVTKAGRLTLEERQVIEQHPELGSQALRKLGPTHDWLAEVVFQAHERWNGQGYPNKLKGGQINEFAPIIGAADVFDALVSPRPYRRRFLPHEAVRELVTVERTAFPRKVIKALIEQLSAYPIGTSVRLSSGERGTVIGVNARYPLRPVVVIGDGPGEGSIDNLDARQVDLSASPLVTIVETIEPPDVARLSYPMPTQARLALPVPTRVGRAIERRTTVPGQFPVLLQSLDAIAKDIQELAESVAPAGQAIESLPEGESMWPPRRTAVQELGSALFDKEVMGLFVLEAQVWLAQIERALKKLTESDDHAVRSKLYWIILEAITNLAKSAASVQQSAIEQMVMNLVPMLHELHEMTRRDLRSAAALHRFHEGVARITTALHRLTHHAEALTVQSPHGDDTAIEALSSHSLPILQETATPQPVFQSSEASEPPLLKALRALQQARARSVQPTRDVLEAVILRAGHEAGEIGVSAIEHIVEELQRRDEQFLEDVNGRVTVITQALHDLSQEKTDSLAGSQLDPIISEVEALHELADAVQASIMTMFLDGLRSSLLDLRSRVQATRLLPRLRSFLHVTAYKKASNLRPWLEMVEARVQTLIPMAEQWVNIGRTERADISRILRAYPDGRSFPSYHPPLNTAQD
ncbi:MAG TPA: HD-GYP domain-containing protein [Nitrospira sp.]|nr:HD-GYP domain-containing protein [Nitrospira sp.]